jgi:amidase
VGYVRNPIRRKLKIAMSLTDSSGRKPDSEVQKAVIETAKLLESLGHSVIATERTPLHEPSLVEDFLVYWSAGAAGTRDGLAKQTGKNMDEWLEPWTLGLARNFDKIKDKDAEIKRVVQGFQKLQRNTRRFLSRYDAWLSPVTSGPPPRIGAQDPRVDFDQLNERVSLFAAHTPLHNATGTPAMSVPMHWTAEDLPIGVQLAANFGRDGLLLALAYQLEEAKPWADRLPKLIGG